MSEPKIHVSAPEAVTFLDEAADYMREYHRKHGIYAATWHQLAMPYAFPTFHLNDSGVYPSKDVGSSWKPRGASYTYVIKHVTRENFLIQALDQNNIAQYQIGDGFLKATEIGKNPKKSK